MLRFVATSTTEVVVSVMGRMNTNHSAEGDGTLGKGNSTNSKSDSEVDSDAEDVVLR